MKTIDLTDACRRVEALLDRYGARWTYFVALGIATHRAPGGPDCRRITYRLSAIPFGARGACAGESESLSAALAQLEREVAEHRGMGVAPADPLAAVVVPD